MSTDRRMFIAIRHSLPGPSPPAPDPVSYRRGVAERGETVAAVYEVKPLPIDPAKVQGLSAKLLVSHHDNNYAERLSG